MSDEKPTPLGALSPPGRAERIFTMYKAGDLFNLSMGVAGRVDLRILLDEREVRSLYKLCAEAIGMTEYIEKSQGAQTTKNDRS